MSPLVLIDRNRLPICFALLLFAWLSPALSEAFQIGAIFVCAALMIATLMLSGRTAAPVGKALSQTIGYKLAVGAASITLVLLSFNRFVPFTDLDISGMALPLVTAIFVIAPIRLSGRARNTHA